MNIWALCYCLALTPPKIKCGAVYYAKKEYCIEESKRLGEAIISYNCVNATLIDSKARLKHYIIYKED